jgi:hypothetical protein
MGEQLSGTAGFWQPVSKHQLIRHLNMESAGNEKN